MKVPSPSTIGFRRAYVMMLAAQFFFATMAVCGREAGQQSDWRIATLARSWLVLALAVAVARVAGAQLTVRGTPTLWVRSLTGSVSMLLTFFALTRAESIAIVITFTNTFPLWVTLLAWPVLRERPTIGAALAVVFGIAGVALIYRPDRSEFQWANLAALGAAFCSAVVMLGLHRLKGVDSLAVVVHFSAVAGVMCALYTLGSVLIGTPVEWVKVLDPRVLLLLAAVAILATFGQIFMTVAFRVGSPQRLAVVGLAQVLFALGYSLLLEKSQIEASTIGGIVLIVVPAAWLLSRKHSHV